MVPFFAKLSFNDVHRVFISDNDDSTACLSVPPPINRRPASSTASTLDCTDNNSYDRQFDKLTNFIDTAQSLAGEVTPEPSDGTSSPEFIKRFKFSKSTVRRSNSCFNSRISCNWWLNSAKFELTGDMTSKRCSVLLRYSVKFYENE
uniref:Uncharacterized protein n=1 Tax=Romanomermis culicivorax TaxID=13658 RepID=A0A915IN57_ROMCU